MRVNRLIVPSCKKNGIKGKSSVPLFYRKGMIMNRGKRKRQRQRGSILPVFLIPTAIAAAKAAATGPSAALRDTARKKAIKAATRKKRVGKISAAQWAANKRRVQRMLRQTGAPLLASLRML